MKYLYRAIFSMLLNCFSVQASNILEDTQFRNDLLSKYKVGFDIVANACFDSENHPEALKELFPVVLNTPYFERFFMQYPEIAGEYFATKEGCNVLRQLILSHAQDPNLLPELLSCYNGGESGFYEQCSKDPGLYQEFFNVLTKGYMPISPFPDRLVAEHETTAAVYTPWDTDSLCNRNTKKHHVITFFTLFQKNILYDHPNLKSLKKLLDQDTPLALIRRGKNCEKETLKAAISFFGPLMRGDLYLLQDAAPDLAYECYIRAKVPAQWQSDESLVSMLKRRLGEIELNAFKGLSLKTYKNVDKGLKNLKSTKGGNRAFADMTLAKYYLGLIEPNIHEPKKAFTYLNRNRNNLSVDHIVSQIEMDYYLGLGNKEIFDLQKALEAYENALVCCENFPTLQDTFFLRKSEILFGLYGGEKNIEEAITLVEKTGGYFLLYYFYKGAFGIEYKDTNLAAHYLERGVAMGDEPLLIEKSHELIKAGFAVEALTLLNVSKIHNVYTSYIKARLYANKNLETFNFKKALQHFAAPVALNYRDAKMRVIKLLWSESSKNEMTQDFLDFFIMKLNESISLADFFINLRETMKESLEIINARHEFLVVSADEPQTITYIELDGSSATDSEETDSSKHITPESIQEVNNEEDLVMLSESIEWFMDNLGGNVIWKRKELRPYLIEMGAGFTKDQVLSFPGVEGVFNFHIGHKGTNEVCLSKGYWTHLKKMIRARYEVLLEEEKTNAHSYAKSDIL